MHALNLLSEQPINDAVLLHSSQSFERRMRYRDGVEGSTAACQSWESAELSLRSRKNELQLT